MGTKKKKAAPDPAAVEASRAALKVGTVWTDPNTGKRYNVVEGDCDKCAFGATGGKCPSPVEAGVDFCNATATNTQSGCILVEITDEPPAADPAAQAAEKTAKGKGKKGKAAPVVASVTKRQVEIPYDSILHAEWNKRGDITDASVDDLVASIKAVGLIDRVTVRKQIDSVFYEILAGHRRVEACHLAGLEPIPCEVIECDDRYAHMITAIENMHRVDLTAMQECAVVEDLLNVGFTAEQVAEQTGRHLRWVYRRASVRGLIKPWREAAEEHDLCAAFLEAVARYPAGTQASVLKEIVESPWASKDTFTRGGAVESVVTRFRNASRSMSCALWSKKHPDWCENCPRCSTTCGELFDQDELKDGDDVAGPLCLDPDCWKEKTSAWVAEEQSRLAAKHGDCKAVTNEDRYKLRDTRNKKDGGHTVPVIVSDGDGAGTVMWVAEKAKDPVDGEEPTTSGPSKAERAMSKEIKRMADWLRDDKNVASWFASATTSERLCLALAFGVTSVCDLNGEHSYEKLGTYQSLLEIGDVSGIFAEHIRGSMLEYIRSEKVTGCGPIYERCVKLDELFGCDRTVARKVEVQDGV